MARTPIKNRPPRELAAASLVVDAQTGNTIVAGGNPDLMCDPASLTKLMTAYTLLKMVEDKKLNLDSTFVVSPGAAALDNNTMSLVSRGTNGEKVVSDTIPAGSRMTYREGIVAMMTGSDNSVARAMAENATATVDAKGRVKLGRERDFAVLMNETAQSLEMKNSKFINPTGLNVGTSEQIANLSTARDMAKLATRFMKDFPEFTGFANAPNAQAKVRLPDGQMASLQGPTTSRIVGNYQKGSPAAKAAEYHVVGVNKTGTNDYGTQKDPVSGQVARKGTGIGLLATVENDAGVRLVSVVLGSTREGRYAVTKQNLKTAYQEIQAKPELAQAYASPDVQMASLRSPASALQPERKVARAEVKRPHKTRPRDRFAQVARKNADEPAVVSPVAGVDTAALQTALAAPAEQPVAEPKPSSHSDTSALRPVVYRP
jgi:D-alanyl-D-alanine carboxypeptidase